MTVLKKILIIISIVFAFFMIYLVFYAIQFLMWKNMPDCDTIDLKYTDKLYWNSPLTIPGELKGQVVQCYHNTFESLEKGMFTLGSRNGN